MRSGCWCSVRLWQAFLDLLDRSGVSEVWVLYDGIGSEDLVLWTFALLQIVLKVQPFILVYSLSFYSQSLARAGAAAATGTF